MSTMLIANNYLEINPSNSNFVGDISMLGTVMSNMAYYGFIPSESAYKALASLSKQEITDFWKNIEPSFKEITGEDRNMGDFVVYKNFPKEVLEMSEAEYWIKQILMYWGLPNEMFAETEENRAPLSEKKNLKVLSLSDENTLNNIYSALLSNPVRWSDNQIKHAKELLNSLNINELDLNSFSFKENGIFLINEALTQAKEKSKAASLGKSIPLTQDINILINNATDVLRLASAMSGGDISLRTNVQFRNFTRSERRLLLSLLENSNNLVDDLGLRKEQFKKLFAGLHPGDYKFAEVNKAYDLLYKDSIKTFNSKIEEKIISKDKAVLELLKSRPGEFLRRFHKMYESFGKDAINAFKEISTELKTHQLIKLDKYLNTINDRETLMYPPNGNWSKVQLQKNEKEKIKKVDINALRKTISLEIGERLNNIFPDGVILDKKLEEVKLQTNDQKLANYGRGTSFDIPEEMTFIRTSSFWKNQSSGNTWFDNGWNFFGEDWNALSTCCWNNERYNTAAIFSGDPTTSKELEGRGCQMIDLNLNELEQLGVRYAVWSILSYNKIKFSDANDVLATLQWGEKAQEGNLFEPSRAQMVFPITGESLSKYIAYIDVKEKKLIYMDANLSASVMSAQNNVESLQKQMPAYVEYLNSLPSVKDLMSHAKKGNVPFLYSDKKANIEKNSMAYVFKPENKNNDFQPIDLTKLLNCEKVIHKNKFKP